MSELVTSTAVILAPGACGQGFGSAVRYPFPRDPGNPGNPGNSEENSGRLNPMHRRDTSGQLGRKMTPNRPALRSSSKKVNQLKIDTTKASENVKG